MEPSAPPPPGGSRPRRISAAEQGPEAERRQDTTVGLVELTRWRTPIGRALAGVAHRIGALLGPHAALVLVLVIGLAVTTALGFLAAEVYDAVTDRDGVAGVDRPVLDAILAVRDPATAVVVTHFTDLAGTVGMPLIAIGALLVLGIRRRSWTPPILIVAAGAGSLLMTVAGKLVVGRDRPPLADAVPPYELSASFPSGHTLNAVAILGIVAYLLILRRHHAWSRAAIIVGAVVATVLVAASRVYLGHHWVTDVVAGWLLGAAWLAMVITAHRLYLTLRADRVEPLTERASGPPPSR
ncbi:phosphatase PAP2 family protein [Agrococcus carbonis]|uniref:Undecaprenyl-diphosphatase n=1 Tax=Agrococcus carbonis TaxID=684552 RepID=A0A1H1T395_9MICO|nr:phosphatase PAP2 family protein [Agrococcus carbonis]SDS54654.1 undecaprenyl-diphosphatase [Agrococcus carbonis]